MFKIIFFDAILNGNHLNSKVVKQVLFTKEFILMKFTKITTFVFNEKRNNHKRLFAASLLGCGS